MSICTVTHNAADATVRLHGEVHLQHAGEVRTALLSALAQSERVHIEADRGTRIGLPIMQLLCSAHRMAHRLGSTIDISYDSGHLVDDALNRAGFCGSGDGQDNGCVWQRRSK